MLKRHLTSLERWQNADNMARGHSRTGDSPCHERTPLLLSGPQNTTDGPSIPSSSSSVHPSNESSHARKPLAGASDLHSMASTLTKSASAAADDVDHHITKPVVGQTTTTALAIQAEHELTFRQACALYPAAIGWSVFVSLGVIMLAFDPQLLGNLYATPQFCRDFGYLYNGEYIISAPWQTGLSMGNPVGQVVGALFAAYPMELFGRKYTFGACVALTGCLVFIQFFARSLPVLLVGELLGGLVLGCYVVIAPAYASEVCPVALRGHLTSYVNLCFVIGQLLANGVTAGTEQMDSHWAYSLPFALQVG